MAGVLDFIPLFPTQTEDAIYARLVQWANEGLTQTDTRWVDSREGSLFWIIMRPLAREVATLYDRAGSEVPAAAHPLFTWGTYLDDLAAVFAVERLPSTPAGGAVRFFGVGGELIAEGTVVGVIPAGEDTPQPTFSVETSGTIPSPILTPAGLGASAVGSGGTFLAGTYYWKVTALGGAGETLPSSEVNATVVAAGSANLTWGTVVGATGYRIYRAGSSGAQNVSPALVASVGAVTAYTDTGTAALPGAVPATNTTASLDRSVVATDTGEEGNAAAGAVTEAVTPLDTSVTLMNPAPMVGGTDTETDEALRERFLGEFRSKGSATTADYRRWSLGYPGVGRATVIPVWNGPGTVKVIVATADGQPVAPSVVTGLQSYLDPIPGEGAGIAPVGHIVTVVTSAALAVTLAADLTLDNAYSLDGDAGTVAIRGPLEDSLERYLASLEPGSLIRVSQVIGRLVEIAGVLDVSPASVLINGSNSNLALATSPTPQFPFLSSFTGT